MIERMKVANIVLFIGVFLFGFLSFVNGQLKKLTVGDTIPDLELATVLNYPGGKAKLSDFKGKLLILDFWTMSCGPCLLAMPKMDSLQKEFGGRIQILPVIPLKYINESSLNKVDSFWKHNKFTKSTILSNVIDTSIHKYFDMGGFPYEVWINHSGKIIAITSDIYVNRREIGKIISGVEPNWVVNNSIKFNYFTPFGVNYRTDTIEKVRYFSSARPYIDFVKTYTSIHVDSIAGTKRLFFVNFPVLLLYKYLYQKLGYKNHNRIAIVTNDSSRFYSQFYDYNQEWVKKTGLCYELQTSYELRDEELYKICIDDLDRYLLIRSGIKRVNRKVLMIHDFNNAIVKTNAVNSGIKFNSLGNLVDFINENRSVDATPVVSKHAPNTAISVTLPRLLNWNSDEEIRKCLKNFGFGLSEVSSDIEYLNIEDYKIKN